MIRVLYLINHAGKGGTERYVRYLAEKLNRSDVEMFFAYNEEGPLVSAMKDLGVPVYRLEMRNRFDMRAALALAGLCRKLKIDIVHTQFLREYYIALISRMFGSRVSIVNTCHIMHVSTGPDKLLNRLFSFDNCTTIAVSHATKRFLVDQGVKKDAIGVIHNGVDVDYYSEDSASTVRQEFGIGEDTVIAASIARFSPEKGHAFLLKSIRRLADLWAEKGRKPANKVIFLLAGDGETLEESKKLAQELEIAELVVFAGYRSDVRNILKGSDLYICHSQHETLGLSILEAMACALAVITTDVGGTGEIVNDENQCGMIVPYGDTEAMAKALDLLARDRQLRVQFGKNGLEAVKGKFTIAKMIAETYEVYRNCVMPLEDQKLQ